MSRVYRFLTQLMNKNSFIVGSVKAKVKHQQVYKNEHIPCVYFVAIGTYNIFVNKYAEYLQIAESRFCLQMNKQLHS